MCNITEPFLAEFTGDGYTSPCNESSLLQLKAPPLTTCGERLGRPLSEITLKYILTSLREKANLSKQSPAVFRRKSEQSIILTFPHALPIILKWLAILPGLRSGEHD
jgi:hypothetical protein